VLETGCIVNAPRPTRTHPLPHLSLYTLHFVVYLGARALGQGSRCLKSRKSAEQVASSLAALSVVVLLCVLSSKPHTTFSFLLYKLVNKRIPSGSSAGPGLWMSRVQRMCKAGRILPCSTVVNTPTLYCVFYYINWLIKNTLGLDRWARAVCVSSPENVQSRSQPPLQHYRLSFYYVS